MTKQTLVEALSEALTHATQSAGESDEIDPAAYGAGYDWGVADGLRQAIQMCATLDLEEF